MCELFKCVYIRQRIREKVQQRQRTECTCVCVCVEYVEYVEKKFQFEASRLCSQLSGTSQLFYLLSYEGRVSVTHSVQTLLYSDDKKRIT